MVSESARKKEGQRINRMVSGKFVIKKKYKL